MPPGPVVPTPPAIPSTGAQQTLPAGGLVQITNTGQGGTLLTVSGSGSTRFDLGGHQLTLHTGPGSLPLQIVRTADGQLLLATQEGSLTISGGAQQPLLLAGGLTLFGLDGNNRLQTQFANGRPISISLLQGRVALRPATSATAHPGRATGTSGSNNTPAHLPTHLPNHIPAYLYAGESARLDAASGQWLDAFLGSVQGHEGQLGDSLAPGSGPWQVPAGLPRLTGLPERQRQAGQQLPLDQQLAALLTDYGLPAIAQGSSQTAQSADGLLRLQLTGTQHQASAWPLGRVQIAENQPNGASLQPNGLLRVVVNGLALHLAPAVPDPAALARSLGQLQPQGRARIDADGHWHWQADASAALVFRPHWLLLPVSAAGFAPAPTQASDLLYSADGHSASLLQPALADQARLLQAARQFDPQASLEAGVGTAPLLRLGGQLLTLLPDAALQPIPAAQAGQPVWLDGERLFLPLEGGLAQGMQLR